jgi:hypothetical protein
MTTHPRLIEATLPRAQAERVDALRRTIRVFAGPPHLEVVQHRAPTHTGLSGMGLAETALAPQGPALLGERHPQPGAAGGAGLYHGRGEWVGIGATTVPPCGAPVHGAWPH